MVGIELFVSGNPVINGTFSENTTVPVSLFGFSGTTEIYITQLSDGVIATVSQSFHLWLILSDNIILRVYNSLTVLFAQKLRTYISTYI